jgi:NAD(P)-dependent dehydrogenase (short-subunit alcohol dehydrogenase family)
MSATRDPSPASHASRAPGTATPPAGPRWTLEGRTCLVTGATSGIGLETAVGLAERGARVVIAGRDVRRAEVARADITRRSGNRNVDLLIADLSSQAEIRKLADAFVSGYGALHVLVNNAGAVFNQRKLTVDGLEATFAVNHLAYFMLTGLLLDRIRDSAPARIVNVASDAHRFGSIDWDDLQSERRYQGLPVVSGLRVYGTSKLANILFTLELARRLAGSGVTANSVHPGMVATGLGKNNGALGEIAALLVRPFARTPAQGAATSIHLASAPELAGVSGRYFANARERAPSAAARDAAAARRLWETSARLTGLGPG